MEDDRDKAAGAANPQAENESPAEHRQLADAEQDAAQVLETAAGSTDAPDTEAAAGEFAEGAQSADVAEANAADIERAPEADAEEAAANAPTDAEIQATVEAVLFASDTPLTTAKISMAAELPGREVARAIRELNVRYEQMGSAMVVEEIAGGWQMLTRPQYNDVLARLLRAKSDSKLSQAAMETLAIVAYRQPIIRADVEAIRGVASGEVLRGLMDRNLVKIVGRAEVLGRPMLYGTTRRFLEVFGLAGLEDLPRVDELRTGQQANKPAAPAGDVAQAEATAEDEADDKADADAAPAETRPAAKPSRRRKADEEAEVSDDADEDEGDEESEEQDDDEDEDEFEDDEEDDDDFDEDDDEDEDEEEEE